MPRSANIMFDVWSATAHRVNRTKQRGAPQPTLFVGSSPSSLNDAHPINECDHDEGAKRDFGDGHDLALMFVVRYGRGARLVNRIGAGREVGHTGANKARLIARRIIAAAATASVSIAGSPSRRAPRPYEGRSPAVGRGKETAATCDGSGGLLSHSALVGEAGAVTSSGNMGWGTVRRGVLMPERPTEARGKVMLRPSRARHRQFLNTVSLLNTSSCCFHAPIISPHGRRVDARVG